MCCDFVTTHILAASSMQAIQCGLLGSARERVLYVLLRRRMMKGVMMLSFQYHSYFHVESVHATTVIAETQQGGCHGHRCIVHAHQKGDAS